MDNLECGFRMIAVLIIFLFIFRLWRLGISRTALIIILFFRLWRLMNRGQTYCLNYHIIFIQALETRDQRPDGLPYNCRYSIFNWHSIFHSVLVQKCQVLMFKWRKVNLTPYYHVFFSIVSKLYVFSSNVRTPCVGGNQQVSIVLPVV